MISMRRQIIGIFFAIKVMVLTAHAAPLGIMVPAYFSPSHTVYWSELDFAASRIPLVAIMNPDSGPGASKSTSYVNVLSQLHQAGGTVIGYTYSGYGTRALADVEADIDTYLSWYNVDGFFIDEMADDANTTNYAYYQSLYQYIKSKGAQYSVTGNPGANTQQNYLSIPTVDSLMIFESNGSKYSSFAPSSWVYQYPPKQFVHLPYGVTNITTMSNYVGLAVGRNAGWIYISDSTLYSVMPSYWTNEVNLVQSLNAASLSPTITDPAQPADQSANIGSSITFQVAASGQMPLLYQWFAGTNAVPNATNASYTIPSVQFTNAGPYYVQVSNSISSTNSRIALLTISTNPITYKTITIDGAFGDWAGIPLAYSQPQPAGDVVAFQNLYVANDDIYLYIRFSLYNSANPFTSSQNIFLDADDNAATGYNAHGIGSEMLVQSGSGYRETNGIFNAGTINGLDWAAAPAAPATEFEVRISRNATYALNGAPVFTNNTVAIFLESGETSGNEWFPSPTGGLLYTFATKLTTLAPLSISYTPGNIIISWNGPGTLQSCDSLTNSAAWTNVPNANSPYNTTPANTQQFFRLIQ